jgi:flagellar protein FlaG
MNLDITATAPASPTTPAPGPVEGASTGAARVTSDDAASQAAVTVDTIPSTPPLEVMDAIAVAAQASERLAASGHELRFHLDPPTGKVTVELRDLQGNLLSTVAPSKALDVAAGGSLD